MKATNGRDERRIWQPANHGVDRGRFRFVHRVRLDERFMEDVDPVLLRLRCRLDATTQIGASEWYELARNETFANLNDGNEGPEEGFGQNTTRVGMGR